MPHNPQLPSADTHTKPSNDHLGFISDDLQAGGDTFIYAIYPVEDTRQINYSSVSPPSPLGGNEGLVFPILFSI
jgi:hypothetical protein